MQAMNFISIYALQAQAAQNTKPPSQSPLFPPALLSNPLANRLPRYAAQALPPCAKPKAAACLSVALKICCCPFKTRLCKSLRRADWVDRVQRFINTSKSFRRFSSFKEHAPVGNQQSANHNRSTSKRPKARIFRNHCPDQQRGQDRFK